MNAAYVILALPLAGFLLLLWLGRRLGEPAAGWLATLLAAGSFVATLVTFAGLLNRDAGSRTVIKQVFTWVPVAALHVNIALQLDPLSVLMALFVTGVGSLIHLYSIGYMRGDRRYSSFFVLLNLFLFSMLCLVLADNFLFSFLGWEGVGFCSYQLVSFWFDRNRAAVAGKKAFVTNRVGDFGFMIGMFLIFAHFGSLNYADVFKNLNGAPGALASVTATGIALMLFLGAAGKSAQLPLYIWLPDAMEGPTPVSALIHAATMVTAGVYLMARIAPILHYSPDSLTVIAIVGAITALFAATIACAQDDIKKVLAYSTISQLGYMFIGIGSGAYVAGLFHMVTHAFFKGLLFLCAGSVIHGMHEEQDMKKMGALRRWMSITFVTFLIGWLAISGIPPFAGFWSKDDILAAAWHKSVVLWAIGFVTAGLTAYYMSRQVALVWFGEARWASKAHPAVADASAANPEIAEHEPVADSAGIHGAAHPTVAETDEAHVAAAHGGSEGAHGELVEPHESPLTMTTALVVLGFLSVVGGVLNLPFGKFDLLARWLDPVFPRAIAPDPHVDTGLKVVLGVAVTVLCLLGLVAGFVPWQRRAERPQIEPAVLSHGWYYDAGVAAFVGGPGTELADFAAYRVDQGTIDGGVNGVAWLVRHGGGRLRRLQTGYVRNYALGVAGGAAALLLYIAVRAVG